MECIEENLKRGEPSQELVQSVLCSDGPHESGLSPQFHSSSKIPQKADAIDGNRDKAQGQRIRLWTWSQES